MLHVFFWLPGGGRCSAIIHLRVPTRSVDGLNFKVHRLPLMSREYSMIGRTRCSSIRIDGVIVGADAHACPDDRRVDLDGTDTCSSPLLILEMALKSWRIGLR